MVLRVGIGIVLLVTAGIVYRTLAGAGAFKRLDYHQELECRPILGVWSSEDITIDPASGFAFISATDRRARGSGGTVAGAIFGLDLTDSAMEILELTRGLNFDFRPHGISLWKDEESSFLFAVNHRDDRDSVEIFRLVGRRLEHLESIVHERIYNANDVLAVGPRHFYVTRDHGGLSATAQQIEETLGLPLSSVLYFDGASVREVAADISYANGINSSPDGSTIYVAGTRGRRIHIFERDPGSGDLTPRRAIDLETGVDNIEVDVQGRLWIGAHPKLLDFVRYAADPEATAPSQVLRIGFDLAGSPRVDEIMLTDGRFLSGASVAARWKDSLLVGSVYDRRFLLCRLDEQ